MEVGLGTCARALELPPANEQGRTCMWNQLSYGDLVERPEGRPVALLVLDFELHIPWKLDSLHPPYRHPSGDDDGRQEHPAIIG